MPPAMATVETDVTAIMLKLSGISGVGFAPVAYGMYPQLSGTLGLPGGFADAGGHD